MVNVIVMVFVRNIWKCLLIVLLSIAVLLSLLVFAKCPVTREFKPLMYENSKDFKSGFVDSKIDCLPWSVFSSRPSQTFSPTAAEIGKRVEEEKRVLNLKMSAYG